jgi:hypothetical protein
MSFVRNTTIFSYPRLQLEHVAAYNLSVQECTNRMIVLRARVVVGRHPIAL